MERPVDADEALAWPVPLPDLADVDGGNGVPAGVEDLVGEQISIGLQLSVSCAEDAPLLASSCVGACPPR